jgi:uncharacterized protein YbjT (DUF2867 family)/uncharacterized protein YndB with AHSA1/START domain
VLLTGGTGYVGGRLAPRLIEAGYHVRCVVRSGRKLASRSWAASKQVEILEIDAHDTARLTEAMRGCIAGYYLIHSMMLAGRDYAQRDEQLATRFAQAAAAAGLPRIIYLGGLGEMGDRLSEHLASRRHVEQILASTGVPVTVFRAAMIIGSGSASFEILRYLVERLPVMITPRWVNTLAQPIAIRNVLHYLQACLSVPATVGQTLDIGGPDVLTYRHLMQLAARELGLRRRVIVPVPVLTPRLSALWIHLVTPVPYEIAKPLGEGLRNRVVCRDDRALELMPQTLLSAQQSIAAALARIIRHDVETAWSDAAPMPGDAPWAGGKVFIDERQIEVAAPPARVFEAFCKVGGEHGWFGADWLWWLRGAMDRVIGGPGLRRGRRDPDHLQVGDAVDFWRVLDIEPGRRVTLGAEMKLPGHAQLQFTVEPISPGQSRLTQTARFWPRGLLGLAYWYAVCPLHGIVFQRMLCGIRDDAQSLRARETSSTHAHSDSSAT